MHVKVNGHQEAINENRVYRKQREREQERRGRITA